MLVWVPLLMFNTEMQIIFYLMRRYHTVLNWIIKEEINSLIISDNNKPIYLVYY